MSPAPPLGRLAPETWEHVEKFPFSAPTPVSVERTLALPGWRPSHDQGREGSCVGHAVALERAISNAAQLRAVDVLKAPARYPTVRYDPVQLWRAAKAIDEWGYTKPDDDYGTSVKAAYEICRTLGLAPVRAMLLVNGQPRPVGAKPADPGNGISAYRWATNVDLVRAAIASGTPVAIGVDWHAGFDVPLQRGTERWLPTPKDGLGAKRGGHSVTLYGASDRRQAFRLCNSWGRAYPLVWLPYALLELLLARAGEAALVTDK